MRKYWTAAIGAAVLASAAVATPANAQSWQCATFARAFSGLQLFGRAAGWWKQAVGKYAEGAMPQLGSVLVFRAGHAMGAGHVATVTQIISNRVIAVTHANWSPIDGHRGQIERDVTIEDTSANNDWSEVKVWYAPLQDLGTKSYRTYGFIYAPRPSAPTRPRAPLLIAETSRTLPAASLADPVAVPGFTARHSA
ncbi:MAG: CHAP domain-containing protein [Sphingomonadaceae bacterium]|nr:CHAP domain-containing protein [Sphingomonadaceae bacterium]